jgi:hypothetical protein
MSSGILRNWHVSKLSKSKTPIEYFFAMQEYMLYELNVISFNTKERIKTLIDKYKEQLS